MSDNDSVEQRKAEAARRAGDNHEVGVDGDDPSRADEAAAADAATEPDTTPAAQEPPD